MAEAVTRAAAAAERGLERAFSGAPGANEGSPAVSRIFESPNVSPGDDPMIFQQWKPQFTSWLSFGDARYVETF